MKKKFTSYFKPMGFRINSTKGEAFIKKEDLHFFIRLSISDNDFGNEYYSFSFGVNVNSPFEGSYEPFEHSVYMGRFCYGGDRSDIWNESEFTNLLNVAEKIAIPWINEMMNLDNLTKHIEWRIEEGIVWVEPEQFREEKGRLSNAGQQITDLFGGAGNKINHEWVKRFYKPLAIIYNIDRKPELAIQNIQKYLKHIWYEPFRVKEIDAIEEKLINNTWPVTV